MPDSHLTDVDRARAVQLLERTRDELAGAVEDLSAAQWNYQPTLDRWSIGLIVEHLGIVEQRLFGQVERALARLPNVRWASETTGKDQLVEKMLTDRGTPRQAPDGVVPTGAVDRTTALQRFRERRATTIAFAETTREPLKAHTLDHHRAAYGTLNAYQWLIYIPFHLQRHLAQIDEIKGTPGYPHG